MTLKVGDSVCFVRDYRLELPPEHEGTTVVERGTTGEVVSTHEDFVVIAISNTLERVSVWWPGKLSEVAATTEVLEKRAGG